MDACPVRFESLDLPSTGEALSALPPPTRRWFADHFATATAAQRLAWPALAAHRNLLLSAPTGSGKTLAAFLPFLGALSSEPPSAVRCLYVAPLKALINDARKNLRVCLRSLPATRRLRVAARTGDTPTWRRRDLRRRPPDILLLTPESLSVLLSLDWSAELFASLHVVIVDEVHALAADKRGADLALSLERLESLAARAPQRIGLSATCAPLSEAAAFLTGADRPCALAWAGEISALDLRVEFLEPGGGFLTRLVERLLAELTAHRTTLIFAQTRGLAERVGWALMHRAPSLAAQIGIHHSALDVTRRRDVERRLKRGRMRAVVTSTSLELGIDVGSVDAVVLIHPPGGAVRLLQRVGRAGHGPGRVRRGLVLAASAAELAEAAVTASACASGEWERLRAANAPLDVLCQQLLGMASQRDWSVYEAYALVRRAYPYRDLPREDFDSCIDYLSGRRRDGSAWLPSRLRWNGDRFHIANQRAARIVRCNLGTILSEEPRPVREQRCPAPVHFPSRNATIPRLIPVGEVDQAFADRLNPGDRFLLDGRCLEVRRCDWGEVVVEETAGRPAVPRWGGDGPPLAAELAARLYLLRARASEALRDGRDALTTMLAIEYGLGEPAADALADYFQTQEMVSEIPDDRVCLVEAIATSGRTEYFVHTPLPRAANDALARVAARRLANSCGAYVGSVVADLGFMLGVEAQVDLPPERWRALLSAENFDLDWAQAIEGSVTLRERFRRAALVGLMLLRHPLGGPRRVGGPTWAERRLYDRVVAVEPQFVLLRQARREVSSICCDARAARTYADELPQRAIRCRRLVAVSPFASDWSEPGAGERPQTPAESLALLHAALTGGPDAGFARLAAHA